ncbi:peptidoglycan DD-metalloendopeptidase family protein [Maribellus comscasis]|uniref:Peptidoglycan DD-metalloendopeptidase family protein n=1 Tax=Maribellus comscasis TaxID=2681766 RepID=A0A6I6JZ11_9BACT|nr:urea transporter [Maribellus comscasis]QGY44383.1 peptidoglycan DD-metalloendopeptidase family protein [Maribellus comscasis]
MKNNTLNGRDIVDSVLNSYSQVFFSKSKLLAFFLIVISFFDYGAGIGGLISVFIANALARFLGYNKYFLNSGLYGFNALLVGLGVGLFYQPSVPLYILITVAAVLTFFLTVVFQGVLGKYGLPYLSLPFLLAIWVVALSAGDLSALNISERGIYTYNELYALGGQTFVNIYEFLENHIRSSFIRIYFHSLGAIFFQTHLLAGIIIAIGLLIYSRITFVLSVLGYSVAYLFYHLVGIEFNSLGYTFIGFNYILTAIALGGYYLVPGKVSYGWIILLLPAVVLITTSTQQIFLTFKISPYSLPFNVIVLMFLYALKLREVRPKKLVETPVQLGKPEKNLYLYSGNLKRFPAAYPVSASLPFYGEWTINQGHNGEHTHKGAWRHAWDFVITDKNGAQFKGSGDFHEDYFCFGKTVLAPFDGTVVEAVNNVEDNTIGDINTKTNWGNTVIIKHNDYLYAKLSHLKFHSVEVKPGDQVKKGQIIGRCGNSGRSPYPHLHFQFQTTPYIGSVTLDYPFGHYLLKEENALTQKNFDFPKNKQMVVNPSKNEILSETLHFIPGQRLKIDVEVDSKKQKWQKLAGNFELHVETDVFNTTYIRCPQNAAKAYLYNDENLHYFTNFTGSKNTALYWFFISLFKVPLGFLPNSKIYDSIPLNMMFSGALKFLQDFIAPVFLFLKVDYALTIKEAGDILSSGDIKMAAVITKKIFGRETAKILAEIKIKQEGKIEIDIEFKEAKIKLICQNELD